MGRQITAGTPNDCRVRRKVPTMSQILCSVQCICFQKTSGSNTGATNLLWEAIWRPRTCYAQGRNEDRWRPAQEPNMVPPIFEPEVLWKQICCNEGSICEIVGNFRRSPQSFGAPIVISVPGELLPPFTPSLRPYML